MVFRSCFPARLVANQPGRRPDKDAFACMTRSAYASDLTDAQWRQISPLIPPASSGGRRRTLNMREVVNALLYLQHTRCRWRDLPESFFHRSSVRHYHDRWHFDGTWQRIQVVLQLKS